MDPVENFELIIAMFLAVLALHYVARRLALPPAVALLTGGGALAFVPGLPTVAIDPELVLVIFLPPLLMDGAWFTALASFRRHIAGILSLAVGAVFFTTAVVAVVAKLLMPALPWAACAALGAIVSPPDAVSARAVLQRVKLPRRLSTLLEGESLLNDAAGLVLFRFAVAAMLTGSFSLSEAAGSFVLLVVGGIAVGGAIGALWVLLLRRLGDDHLMIVATVLVCWSAYIAGEMLDVSGVIATVAAGLTCGWYQHVVFAASVRLRAHAFWQVLVFLMEAAVFMLIGFSLRGVLDRVGGVGVVFDTMAGPVLLIVLAVIVARFLWVFGVDGVLILLRRFGWSGVRPLGAGSALIMSWAGMRGVVTLAVALSLPDTMPGRDMMLVTAFAVILVTVLLQGTSLGLVIRMAGKDDVDPAAPPLDLQAAENAVYKAQLAAVEGLAFSEDGRELHPQLLRRYRTRATASDSFEGTAEERTAAIDSHFDTIIAAVDAGRAALVRMHRDGQIDDEILHDLERDLDLEELAAAAAKG
ncbi:Na+/H+ antiporter [Sphingomonas prati]|uniref:CPA1 family monovalent cation:H+ antiporter n=1 Tax=Sphingomonas prati TaxID=1843237 RepID=A0A7W9BR85_9SPHN|nr:Na+/H+ antiporter [Sphingomonas prati]MBB5728668.1 CPA1 family monovalent cation:H+ antiporter [Sphingomonas prati]GGE72013.1 Na+/H+ antiporter [Sphingomonas prati]